MHMCMYTWSMNVNAAIGKLVDVHCCVSRCACQRVTVCGYAHTCMYTCTMNVILYMCT